MLQEGIAASRQRPALLAQRSARDADEAGTEAPRARVVLVAARLVDLALPAEVGFMRQHRHAIALHAAIAAAFANGLVDEQALGRIDHLALLAATTFLGSAGLLV